MLTTLGSAPDIYCIVSHKTVRVSIKKIKKNYICERHEVLTRSYVCCLKMAALAVSPCVNV